MCVYTTCEHIVIGMIALTPTYSIISYGSRDFYLRIYIYAHFINTTRA